MKIGIDVDGVLADFLRDYNKLILERTGIRCPESPTEWNYEAAAGVTPLALKAIWQEITDSPTFWSQLYLLDGARATLPRLNLMAMDLHDVYFITHRFGHRAKQQTEAWLRQHGIVNPTVILTKTKGPVVGALKLDWFADDRPENLVSAYEHAPTTELYLVDRPWNRNSYLTVPHHIIPDLWSLV